MIRVFCAWCGEFMHEKSSEGADELGDSHGICEDCYKAVVAEMRSEYAREV